MPSARPYSEAVFPSLSESPEISSRILEEMKDARDEEAAPQVICYFDIPMGRSLIYLAVKNIGKGIANDVKIAFEPPLQNSGNLDLSRLPLLQNGITSLPPGHEIRTLFDSTVSYFGGDLPLLLSG